MWSPSISRKNLDVTSSLHTTLLPDGALPMAHHPNNQRKIDVLQQIYLRSSMRCRLAIDVLQLTNLRNLGDSVYW